MQSAVHRVHDICVMATFNHVTDTTGCVTCTTLHRLVKDALDAPADHNAAVLEMCLAAAVELQSTAQQQWEAHPEQSDQWFELVSATCAVQSAVNDHGDGSLQWCEELLQGYRTKWEGQLCGTLQCTSGVQRGDVVNAEDHPSYFAELEEPTTPPVAISSRNDAVYWSPVAAERFAPPAHATAFTTDDAAAVPEPAAAGAGADTPPSPHHSAPSDLVRLARCAKYAWQDVQYVLLAASTGSAHVAGLLHAACGTACEDAAEAATAAGDVFVEWRLVAEDLAGMLRSVQAGDVHAQRLAQNECLAVISSFNARMATNEDSDSDEEDAVRYGLMASQQHINGGNAHSRGSAPPTRSFTTLGRTDSVDGAAALHAVPARHCAAAVPPVHSAQLHLFPHNDAAAVQLNSTCCSEADSAWDFLRQRAHSGGDPKHAAVQVALQDFLLRAQHCDEVCSTAWESTGQHAYRRRASMAREFVKDMQCPQSDAAAKESMRAAWHLMATVDEDSDTLDECGSCSTTSLDELD